MESPLYCVKIDDANDIENQTNLRAKRYSCWLGKSENPVDAWETPPQGSDKLKDLRYYVMPHPH